MTDTAQQKLALRRNRAARKVRDKFPKGTRVVSLAGRTGTVERHIPDTSSLGGMLRIRWDEPVLGKDVGRVTPTTVNRIDQST
jgi:hypothetical protein